MDALAQFKDTQRQGWAHFGPLEAQTTPTAARLVKFAGISGGQHVLDVACGTGVVAVTAARRGAHVTGLDLTPELLQRAREHARIARVDITWHEGDAEQLPFEAEAFDVVVSQFGHIFAPRPEVVTAEMLRVLKPGGTVAFSTWPPELFVGSTYEVVSRYSPPLPSGVAPPTLWGDPAVVRARLGAAIKDLMFDRAQMPVFALSPAHHRVTLERMVGSLVKLVESLSTSDPDRLAAFRAEYDAVVARYFDDNMIRQDYLLTRATKV
jgi:SAM-dependent methyltransferase